MKQMINSTMQALEKNHIEALYFEDTKSLVDSLMNMIKEDDVVGIGGSVTIQSLGIAKS
jgi:hypothetical protein